MSRRRLGAIRTPCLALLGIALVASCTVADRHPDGTTSGPATSSPAAAWLRDVQVVSVWPLEPDQLDRFGVDVPGVFTWWDEGKVRRLQDDGRIAVVNVEGLAAEADLLREHPELRAAVSKDIFGNDARAEWYQSLQGVPDPVLVLSIMSPVFQRYLLAQGRRAVDIGADAFYVDEIQTSALLIGRDLYAAGFGALEMAAYDRQLEALGFSSPAEWLLSNTSSDWLRGDVAAHLESAEMAPLSVADILGSSDPALLVPQAALFDDYRRFYENQAFRIMSRIIRQVREYAFDRGRSLAIGANLAGMGNRTWWSPLMSVAWGRQLDFIVFENDLSPPGSPSTFSVALPEGSFAPTYRLGRALTPGLVAAFPSVAFAPALHSLERYATYLSVMYAEAFAFEGNWAIGWWNEEMDWPRNELAPSSLAGLTRFVTRWHRLYEGPRAANGIAVLYSNEGVLENPQRHESYYGLCQALAALNIQYDVVYTGDSRFGDAPLEDATLGRYETVFAPTASALTRQQADALERYVAAGGRVVALDPVSPLLDRTPGVQVIDDVGLRYRSGDRAEALDQIERELPGIDRVLLSPAGEGVLVTSYLREALPGLVLHFVNERYGLFADTVEPADDLDVRVERPAPFDDSWKLWVIAPGSEPRPVPYVVESGWIRFTLPRLDVYAVAVFAPELP